MTGPIGRMFEIISEAIVESAHYADAVDGDTYVELYANDATAKIVDKLYENGYAVIKQ